jgi:hypothetical protein
MGKEMGHGGLALVLGCCLMASCGDDDGGSSGVSGGKLLTDLSDDDNQKLCEYYEKLYKDSLGSEEQYCTAYALDDAWDEEECEDYKSECLEEGYYESDQIEDWGCDTRGLIEFETDDECTATVAEVEACLKEDVSRGRELTKYTCEDAERLSEEGEDDEGDTAGPACEKVFTKCPGAEF